MERKFIINGNELKKFLIAYHTLKVLEDNKADNWKLYMEKQYLKEYMPSKEKDIDKGEFDIEDLAENELNNYEELYN